jgi:hypothetical protein
VRYTVLINIATLPHVVAESDSPFLSQAEPMYVHIPAMRKPDWGEVCWLAGLFEGEGSFAENEIKIPQKEPEILYWCRELFGGAVYGPHRTTNTYTGKTYWRYVWSARNERARSVAYTIYHLLSSRRREQAKRLLLISRDDHVAQPDRMKPAQYLWDWLDWHRRREFWRPL